MPQGTVINGPIENRHIDDCGRPPAIDPDEFAYVSYFENAYGEQLVFVYDADEEVAVQHCGDAGWGRAMVFDHDGIISIDADSSSLDIKAAAQGPDPREIAESAMQAFGHDEDDINEALQENNFEEQMTDSEEMIWTKACLLAVQRFAR